MRPSDETECAQCTPALEAWDWQEYESHVFSGLREKSVGYDRHAELTAGGKRCALGGSLTYANLDGPPNDFRRR